MDLYRIIQDLVDERNRIDQIIRSLETVTQPGKTRHRVTAAVKRRGRKSMDSAARKDVSERMKRYWAKRRAERAASE